MATAIYARVSTDKQDHQNQMPELLACNPQFQFVDYASGKSGDREQFQAMLQAAERHEFDELVVWSLDRMTREGTFVTLGYLDKLSKLGVTVRALHDDMQNELLVLVKSWMAKQERLRISERVKLGMARVKAAGVRVGRPPLAKEQQCRVLRKQKLTVRQIAREVGVSKSYVARALV